MKKNNNPRVIPFFSNSDDNLHCLQACVKSVLNFYFPLKKFSNEDIDLHTLQEGGWSWFPPTVIWLHNLGLKVHFYSEFDYKKFSDDPESHLKEAWSHNRYNLELINGSLKNLAKIQKSAHEMLEANLWTKKSLSTEEIVLELKQTNKLVIGKTFHHWLNGEYVDTHPHYILILKEYSPGKWAIHDPGLPPIKNRKVENTINNNSITDDVLIVEGLI